MLTVMTVTLDWIYERFPPPNFIKCDAEGAETWILQGAEKVLSNARPVINMEMPKENAIACKAIFERQDYVTFSAYDPIALGKELTKIDSIWEVLAIPREKVEQLVGV